LLAPFNSDLAKIIDTKGLTVSELGYLQGAFEASFNASIATAVSATAAASIADSVLIMGTPYADYMGGFSAKIQSDIAAQVRLGYASGEGMAAIINRVAGLEGITKLAAQRMTRTMVNSIANNAREEYYKANSDIVKGFIHNSTLDKRTCLVCAARDNLAWDKDKKPVGHDMVFIQPPVHTMCRCIMLAWYYPASELPKAKRDKLTTGTRASMDGQVPQSNTFEEWMDGKPESFQRDYLGKGRYELYKAGKVSFGDLVTMNGRQLTLKELDKL